MTDYSGQELYPGDLVAYSARQGNRVRMADAIVREVSAKLVQVPGVGSMLVPVLKIQPTGVESGFTKRRKLREEWISAEHVRLIVPQAERG
ncbi:hypothetical protein [Kitasatospora cathayae]|uniref:Uncharacterized protein n=1 Tax=Kitasatospora cathayae TaxID=3004092 RepID=A0ABY7Q3D3_9ACTN|nr:hypothetical protein [Kitasatospora sp. HUAS 3-15]WBP87022.1 hypothetical protein O1G21_15010 [Kitasatospora sp. HUAS 3-15]